MKKNIGPIKIGIDLGLFEKLNKNVDIENKIVNAITNLDKKNYIDLLI